MKVGCVSDGDHSPLHFGAASIANVCSLLIASLRYIYPPEISCPLPIQDAVILCHGFASHKNGFHSPAIAKALEDKGLTSLRIDLSGNGESEGVFKYANYKQEVSSNVQRLL